MTGTVRPEDIDDLFDADTLHGFCGNAKVPDAKCDEFGVAVREAARNYLIEKARPKPEDIRIQIEGLGKKVGRSLEGRPGALTQTINTLKVLTREARAVLEYNAHQTKVPDEVDLLDPEHGREALNSLYGLCGRGLAIRPGRKRPGGKQSRPTIEPRFAGPKLKRGRRKYYEKGILVARLGYAYEVATGKPPSRWPSKLDRGPFINLVGTVLNILGEGMKDGDPRIIRDYLAEMKSTTPSAIFTPLPPWPSED